MILSQLRRFWARLRSTDQSQVRRPVRDVRPNDSLESLEVRKMPSVSAVGTTTGLVGAHAVQQPPSYGTTTVPSKNQQKETNNHENGPIDSGPGHIIAMYVTTGNNTISGGSGNDSIVGGSGNDII